MRSLSPTVAIVGAGLGGICLAQHLAKHGIAAGVYERAARSAHMAQGFWIEINGDGVASLKDCLQPDHFTDLMAKARPTNRPDCRWLPRGILQDYLLCGLAAAVHFEKAFLRYDHDPRGGVTAHFADGTSVLADVLVGADGVHSNVRKQLLPQARRADTGVFALGGTALLTPPVFEALPGKALEHPIAVNGPNGQQIFIAVWRTKCEPTAAARAEGEVHTRIDAGLPDHVMWRFSALSSAYGPRSPETMSAVELKTAVLEMIAPCGANMHRLVELIDPATIFALPIRTCVPVDPWPSGPATLIGDAIHGMPPHGGFGANTAMRDASVLGRQLAAASRREKSLLEAVRDYETEMLAYGFAAVRRAIEILQSINRPEPAKLPWALRLAPEFRANR